MRRCVNAFLTASSLCSDTARTTPIWRMSSKARRSACCSGMYCQDALPSRRASIGSCCTGVHTETRRDLAGFVMVGLGVARFAPWPATTVSRSGLRERFVSSPRILSHDGPTLVRVEWLGPASGGCVRVMRERTGGLSPHAHSCEEGFYLL